MGFKLVLRLVVIALAVAIGSGLMVRTAQSEPQHGQMVVSTVIAGGDLMIGANNRCAANQHTSAQLTCFATCTSVADLPSLGLIFNSFDARLLSLTADPVAVDHTVPPEPYPPKSYDLS